MSVLWKVACQEDLFPGMWQRWFRNQCVAVGWPPAEGFRLDGSGSQSRGWSAARKAIQQMQVGDHVVVALRGNRVGRVGQITEKAIEDREWDPFVPPSSDFRTGDKGRRVLVRWDLTIGPDSQDLVVQLPQGGRFSTDELRPTVSQIRSRTLESLKSDMSNPSNWVNLLGGFRYEKALSDFLANYPGRLEDGLLPYPETKIRERVFPDKTRLDVLLIDEEGRPVIVECKQHAPSARDVQQLRHYMSLLQRETRKNPRGILVHGGATKLAESVIIEARKEPRVEVISYGLDVQFRPSIF